MIRGSIPGWFSIFALLIVNNSNENNQKCSSQPRDAGRAGEKHSWDFVAQQLLGSFIPARHESKITGSDLDWPSLHSNPQSLSHPLS